MSIFALTIIFGGVICFLYFFWNRLKEDYISTLTFNSAFYILLGILVFYVIGRFLLLPHINFAGFESGFLFWFCALGSILGLLLGILRYKLRFFETLEAYGVGLMYVVLSVFIYDTF